MFVTKIKNVLAVVLVIAALAGAAGLSYQTQAAEQATATGEPPIAEKDQKKAEEKPAPVPPALQPAKTDQERIVGNWIIKNDDSQRKGEMWVITEDSILMYANYGGLNAFHYAHRLDASKNPKQIDITISRINGPTVGVIKGIYVLDGDELRLCLAAQDKDRPAAFPKKPGPGEVLILHRATSGASPPKAKQEQPAKTDEPNKTDNERIVGNWIIMNDDSQRKGEAWVISDDRILMHAMDGGAIGNLYLHRLDAGKDPKQIDITVTKVNGPPVGIIKGLYALDGDELRLCLAAQDKDRPAAFPKKPGPGEVLIFHRATSGASLAKAKEAKPDKTDGSDKTDNERMVGNWYIVNDDSQRKGEMWVIYEDRILMYAKHGGANAYLYLHRLDAGKDPKQIDITVTKVNGPPVGVIKGLYALDGDELRLCLAALDKDRPAAFPKKPGPGEVLILHRDYPGAGQPKAKEEQPAAKKEQTVLTPEEAIQQRDKATITVQFKVASVEMTSHFAGSDLLANSEIELADGKGFSVLLRGPVRDQILRLGIEPAKHFSGKVFRVTGRVQAVLQPDTGKGPYWIVVDDLKQFEVVGNRTP